MSISLFLNVYPSLSLSLSPRFHFLSLYLLSLSLTPYLSHSPSLFLFLSLSLSVLPFTPSLFPCLLSHLLYPPSFSFSILLSFTPFPLLPRPVFPSRSLLKPLLHLQESLWPVSGVLWKWQPEILLHLYKINVCFKMTLVEIASSQFLCLIRILTPTFLPTIDRINVHTITFLFLDLPPPLPACLDKLVCTGMEMNSKVVSRETIDSWKRFGREQLLQTIPCVIDKDFADTLKELLLF